MKNFILLVFASLALCSTSSAQLKTMAPTPNDTSISGATVNLDYASQGYSAVTTIQFNLKKVSGTVAGIAILQGSLDGTNYANISTDTFTVTDVATQSKLWALGATNYINYRVKFIPTGTPTAVPTASVLFRKP